MSHTHDEFTHEGTKIDTVRGVAELEYRCTGPVVGRGYEDEIIHGECDQSKVVVLKPTTVRLPNGTEQAYEDTRACIIRTVEENATPKRGDGHLYEYHREEVSFEHEGVTIFYRRSRPSHDGA